MARTRCRSIPALATAIRSARIPSRRSTRPTKHTPSASGGRPATCCWWTTSAPRTRENPSRNPARSLSRWPTPCSWPTMGLAFPKSMSDVAAQVRREFCRILLLCFTVTPAMAQGGPDPVSFSLWASNIANLTDVTFVSADFNNDGRMDLLLHGITNNLVTAQRNLVLTNRGNGSFGLFSSQPGSIASFSAGDWNNDGKVDLLRLAGGLSAISIQTNNGFQDYLSFYGPVGGRTAWIDFDADGDLDGFTAGGA